MKTSIVAIALLFGAVAFAQAQQSTINYAPVNCIRGGEMPVLQVSLDQGQEGTLRAYFRRVGATDWCSVEGNNHGLASNIVLPKFEDGDEIEYYFVVIKEKVVVAKSPRLYRVKATTTCDSMFARHSTIIMLDCSGGGAGPIPAAMGAGFAVRSTSQPQDVTPIQPGS